MRRVSMFLILTCMLFLPLDALAEITITDSLDSMYYDEVLFPFYSESTKGPGIFNITNTGATVVSITDMSISGNFVPSDGFNPCPVYLASEKSFTLLPGESRDITVCFVDNPMSGNCICTLTVIADNTPETYCFFTTSGLTIGPPDTEWPIPGYPVPETRPFLPVPISQGDSGPFTPIGEAEASENSSQGRPAYITGTTGYINIRATASLQGEIIGSFAPGDPVIITEWSPDGQWAHVLYGAEWQYAGWVFGAYLSEAL